VSHPPNNLKRKERFRKIRKDKLLKRYKKEIAPVGVGKEGTEITCRDGKIGGGPKQKGLGQGSGKKPGGSACAC